MKIKASITISRDSSNTINVRIEDDASHATFVRMEFSTHDFMMALTGLASIEAQSTEVVGLDVVGKRKIQESRAITYPGDRFDTREEMRAWLVENGAEDGWIVNPYLGSQGSIKSSGDQAVLNYTVYRYEEIDNQEPSNG